MRSGHFMSMSENREPWRAAGGIIGAMEQLNSKACYRALQDLVEIWRPWRAYAAQHLWAADQAAHG